MLIFRTVMAGWQKIWQW